MLGEVWTEMIAAKLGVDVHHLHEKVAERMATPKPGSVEAGRLLEWPAHDRQQPLPGSRLVAPAGRTSCRFTEVVEGRLLGGLRLLGPLVPGHSGGSVVPHLRHLHLLLEVPTPADQPVRGRRPSLAVMAMPTIRLGMGFQDLGRPQPDAELSSRAGEVDRWLSRL